MSQCNRCISHAHRATFHQCEVLSINRKNGDRDVYFEGLCKRPAQKPFAVTTLPPEKGLSGFFFFFLLNCLNYCNEGVKIDMLELLRFSYLLLLKLRLHLGVQFSYLK